MDLSKNHLIMQSVERLTLLNGPLPRMVVSPVLTTTTTPYPSWLGPLRIWVVRARQEEHAGPGHSLKPHLCPDVAQPVSSGWVPTWLGAQVSMSLRALCGEPCTYTPGAPCAALTLSSPAPDINPAWYTGRGIRPVGRFGRRRAARRDVTGPGLRSRLSCLPLDGSAKFSQYG